MTSSAGLVGVVALLVVVPAPELGFPLLLFSLRLLALDYDWAARAYVPVARLWDRLKALPGWTKLVAVVAVLVVVGLLYWWLS